MGSHICDETALIGVEAYKQSLFYSNLHITPACNLTQEWHDWIYPVDSTCLARPPRCSATLVLQLQSLLTKYSISVQPWFSDRVLRHLFLQERLTYMKSFQKLLCCFFAMVLVVSLPALGQDITSITGGLSGAVTDTSGAVVSGA